MSGDGVVWDEDNGLRAGSVAVRPLLKSFRKNFKVGTGNKDEEVRAVQTAIIS